MGEDPVNLEEIGRQVVLSHQRMSQVEGRLGDRLSRLVEGDLPSGIWKNGKQR